MFNADFVDDNKIVGEYDGYVPKWFPNTYSNHYGDYVMITIDIDTGKIINWKTPLEKDLKETFNTN